MTGDDERCRCGHTRAAHEASQDGGCIDAGCLCPVFEAPLATPEPPPVPVEMPADQVLHLRAVIIPPPELVRQGAQPEDQQKYTTVATAAHDIGELLKAVDASTLFAQGGAVAMLIQRPRIQHGPGNA